MERKFDIGVLKTDEIPAMLALQRDNLAQNLDAQTIDSQGFLTFMYDIQTMQKMMQAAPQIIARAADGTLIGYALSVTSAFGQTNDQIRPFINLCTTLPLLQNRRVYYCGQVCVREGWRGMGVFDAMYQGHRQHFSEIFDCFVTEIDEKNQRSLAAHRRVGFETIHRYIVDSTGKDWHIVAWIWR